MKTLKIFSLFVAALVLSTTFVSAQKTRPKVKTMPKTKPIIFAVVFDGKTIEPIAYIEKGKLTQATGGDDGKPKLDDFARNYYKPKTKYDLIFGGVTVGKTEIIKSSIGECSGNSAEVITQSTKAKLKGFVMALATNAPSKTATASIRRRPTPSERSEIESLVRDEYAKHNVAAATLKQLKYHNLTALDVDNDGNPEFVGSYWVEPTANERRTLFIIAAKNAESRYGLVHTEYEEYDEEKVMSGEVTHLDEGIYHNLLLDAYDYDGDRVSEIFTTAQAFEGRNFSVYRREAGKWVKVLEHYNYRCGY